jgi:peptide deformylase
MKKTTLILSMLISLSSYAEGRQLPIMTLGNPVLRLTARELTQAEITSVEIQTLIDDMVVTMKKAGGVGLAAPQVNQSLRLFVMKSWPGVPLTIVINPRVEYIERDGKKNSTEGCLSIPGRSLTVSRYKKLHLSYFDRNGEFITQEMSGFGAIITQHEYDHLNGVLIIDLVDQMMGELNWEKYLASPRM